MHAFNTPVILFIVIVLSYLLLSLLLLGGQKVFFEPLTVQPDDPESAAKSAPEAIATGAEPWKVGEKGGTASGAKSTTPKPADEGEAKS